MSLNGIPFAVTRAAKRIARDASQQGVGCWRRKAGSHRSVQSIGREAAPTFFRGGQKPPGRRQNTADRLILMGDWRDSFAAMI